MNGTQSLNISYGGKRIAIPATNGYQALQRVCAKAFHLNPAEIVGFDNGDVLYPVSFVTNCSPDTFHGDTLHIVLSRYPAPELPAPTRATKSVETIPENQYIMTFNIGGKSERILLSADDMKRLVYLKSKTKIDRYKIHELHKIFDKEASPNGELTKPAFDSCIRQLVTGQTLNAEEKAFLSLALNKMFYAFDKDGNGSVDFREFISGFLGLASGHRTEKMKFAFRMFDENHDGVISAKELFHYMRAFLTVVLSQVAQVENMQAEYLKRLIDETAEEVVHECLRYTDNYSEGKLTIDILESWYENGGRVLMPWLDLLVENMDHALLKLFNGENVDPELQDGTPIFDFVLYEQQHLRIFLSDVEHLDLILDTTGLRNVSTEEVQDAFLGARIGNDGLIGKPEFDVAIRTLIPESNLSVEEQNFLSFVFSNIFLAYDYSNSGKVSLRELVCGFSLFSNGSKSHKLSLAFVQFDTDNDGALSRLELVKFIRSFLIVLFAMNESISNWSAEKVYELINHTSINVTQQIIAYAGKSDLIYFEDFGAWYNTGGVEAVPWLELLDLKKWPNPVDQQRYNTMSSNVEDQLNNNQAVNEQGPPYVFQFELTKEGNTLQVRPRDVAYLELILFTSKLYKHAPEDIINCLSSGAVKGRITKSVFDQCMRELISVKDLRPDMKQELAYALGNIYYAYDRDTTSVGFKELACGMCLLAYGNKSDKLALGFNLFDVDDDGALTFRELVSFLASLLTSLFAVNEDAATKSAQHVWSTVDECALEYASIIFSSLEGKTKKITFEEFAEWYTNGGYEMIPWIELLDLKKWTFSQQFVQHLDLASEKQVETPKLEEIKEEIIEEGTEINEEDDLVFQFSLTDAGDLLEIRSRDVNHLEMVLRATNFATISAVTICESFMERATGGRISKSDFDKCIRDIVQGDKLTPHDRAYVSYVLSNIFYAYDRESTDEVDVREFASGFILLSKGSKSEKLNLAFTLFDDDEDGLLNRRQIWLFIRSFLTVLLALNEESANDPAEEIWMLVDEAAVEIVAKILLQTDREDKDFINFDEFAEWYTSGGYSLIPWLELLDLSKWQLELDSEPTAMSAVGERENMSDDLAEQSNLGEGEQIVFQFNLTLDGQTLDIRPRDVSNLLLIVQTTGFENMSTKELCDSFIEVAENGTLAKNAFDRCIRELVPGTNLTNNLKTYLSFALSNIFYAYDRKEQGKVELREILSGFSLLVSGSKSDKLAMAFSLFDEDEDTKLTREQLERFLASFLTILFALNEEAANCPATDVWATLDLAVAHCSATIFQEVEVTDDKISFEEFADWYSRGGYELVAWLELLNLKKWPTELDDESEMASNASEKENQSTEQEDSSADIATDEDVELIKTLGLVSTLNSLSFNELVDKLRSSMDTDQLDKAAFLRFVDNMVSTENWKEDDKNRYGTCFEGIFDAYDRASTGIVSFEDVVTGLSLLVKGSDVEKLSQAAKFFADGSFTVPQLHRFILAYFTMIAAAKRIQNPNGDESEQKQERRALGVLSMSAAQNCCKTNALDENATNVSDDQVVKWYQKSPGKWLSFLKPLSS